MRWYVTKAMNPSRFVGAWRKYLRSASNASLCVEFAAAVHQPKPPSPPLLSTLLSLVMLILTMLLRLKVPQLPLLALALALVKQKHL